MSSHSDEDATAKVVEMGATILQMCATMQETNTEIKEALTKILDQTPRTNLRLHDLKNRLQVIEQDQEDLRLQVKALCMGPQQAEIFEVQKRLKKYHRWNDMVRPVDEQDQHPDYGDIMDKSTLQLGSAWSTNERLNLE